THRPEPIRFFKLFRRDQYIYELATLRDLRIRPGEREHFDRVVYLIVPLETFSKSCVLSGILRADCIFNELHVAFRKLPREINYRRKKIRIGGRRETKLFESFGGLPGPY